MEKENPVYLKLGYYEGLGAKREMLSSQVSLLNLVKIMRRYNTLRQEELRMKSRIYKEIKELNAKVKETKSYFPFFEIPEKLRKREHIIKVKKEEPVKTIPLEKKIEIKKADIDLEMQLKDIQDRLKAIEKA